MTKQALSWALNAALRSVLGAYPKAIVMGEDVGALGGVFRVTDGLQKEFGCQRVVDTPVAESAIIGTAIGLAIRGYRPICEIQFDGFVYPAFNQIVSQLAKMRTRTLGTVGMPIVIRIPVGGGIGAVEHHSESNEAYFAHTAGLRVVYCSNPQDAYWMLRAAVASEDPVIFYEPKRLYWIKGEIDTAEPPDVLTSSNIVLPGADATLIAYGAMVETCLRAAEAVAGEGRSLEVIDLRTLSPLDLDTLTASVKRTHRCVVAHEAPTFGGFGGELAAAITEACFFYLDAPVLRVGGYNMPYPAAKHEQEYLPDLDRVLDAVDRSFAW